MEKVFRQKMFVPALLATGAFVVLFAGAGIALLALRPQVAYGEVLAMFGMAAFWGLFMTLSIYMGSDIAIDSQSIGRSVFSWTIISIPWRSVTSVRVIKMPSRTGNPHPIVFGVHFSKNGRSRRIAFGNSISNYADLREVLANCVREYSIPVEGDCRDELLRS